MSSVIIFVSVNVIFSILISLGYVGQPWRVSRIVILEGLILLMGVVLGVCILVVSRYKLIIMFVCLVVDLGWS